MKPILFHLFDYPIPSHGVFYVLGFIASFVWGYYESRRLGIDPEKMLNVGFWVVIGIIIGSRAFYVVLHPMIFAKEPLRALWIWEGGMVLYGGAAGCIIAALAAIRLKKLPAGDAEDIVAQSGTLGLAIGRIGCLMAGCCYGRPTQSFLCIIYTDPTSFAFNLVGEKCLYPTPIYSIFWLSVVFAFLVWLSRRKSFPGQVAWSFYIIYPIGRFIIEFYRGDPRGFVREPVLSRLFAPLLENQTFTVMFGGGFIHVPYLSTSQIVSIVAFLVAAVGYFIGSRWTRR